METISMCIGSFPPPGQIQSGKVSVYSETKTHYGNQNTLWNIVMTNLTTKMALKSLFPHTSSCVYNSFNKHCALTTVAPDVRGFLGRRESLGGASGEVQRGRGAQGGQKRE